jgi:hypothetical protein
MGGGGVIVLPFFSIWCPSITARAPCHRWHGHGRLHGPVNFGQHVPYRRSLAYHAKLVGAANLHALPEFFDVATDFSETSSLLGGDDSGSGSGVTAPAAPAFSSMAGSSAAGAGAGDP